MAGSHNVAFFEERRTRRLRLFLKLGGCGCWGGSRAVDQMSIGVMSYWFRANCSVKWMLDSISLE